MGNCACGNKEESEDTSQFSELEIMLQEIIAELFPGERRSFEPSSDVDNVIDKGALDIVFERESIVSRLEQIYIEDEICGICTYAYDEDHHVPRILPCGHTICSYCIKEIARKTNFVYLECPLDRQCHNIKREEVCPRACQQDSDPLSHVNTSAFYGDSNIQVTAV